MKNRILRITRRALACGLALLFAVCPSLAADTRQPMCDEAFYATLDYYGALMDASVVKSYHTRGCATLTDYGVYDEVSNLSDDRAAAIEDGVVTFDLSGDIPDRFYFEGKTARPFEELPWTVSLSYELNGVPTPAEELAGAKGLVEIHLDVLPRADASDYLKNNLVLTAATAFNADDILSLSAEGAEVQLIGNLRAVLFMVMPGEEQHFSIRVGSDDFTFSGMMLLAVPATLAQLDQIADLKEAKEKTEDSYDAICDSLDVILDSLDGMGDSLNATASGLDQLNRARSTISGGKDGLYSDADSALGSLDAMAEALAPTADHLVTASQALTDITDNTRALTENAVALKTQLAEFRKLIDKSKADIDELVDLAEDLEAYNYGATQLSKSLSSDLEALGKALTGLENSSGAMRKALAGLSGISDVGGVEVEGMTVSEIRAAVKTANGYHSQYEAYLAEHPEAQGLSFVAFLVAGGADEADAGRLAALWQKAQEPDFEEMLEQAETADGLIDGVNGKIGEINALIGALASPTAGLLADVGQIAKVLGSDGLTGDMKALSGAMTDLLEDMEDHNGALSSLMDRVKDMGDTAIGAIDNADRALDLLKELDETIDGYIPEAQQTLTDAQVLAGAATDSIGTTTKFLSNFKSLLQKSDGDLDEGTRKSLEGLSRALRQSSSGLDETDTIRAAKDTITQLLDDEWDSHTGGDNNLLLMDATAETVSMTDARNAPPASIQYIMRTKEIDHADAPSSALPETEDPGQGTVWSRICAMFRDFWNAITGIFH